MYMAYRHNEHKDGISKVKDATAKKMQLLENQVIFLGFSRDSNFTDYAVSGLCIWSFLYTAKIGTYSNNILMCHISLNIK